MLLRIFQVEFCCISIQPLKTYIFSSGTNWTNSTRRSWRALKIRKLKVNKSVDVSVTVNQLLHIVCISGKNLLLENTLSIFYQENNTLS